MRQTRDGSEDANAIWEREWDYARRVDDLGGEDSNELERWNVLALLAEKLTFNKV